MQTEAQKGLTLLLLGEIGRVADLSSYPDVEQCIVNALSDASEDVKATSSLALGGIAVGNLQKYLPLLLGRIEAVRNGGEDASQLYLMLKALNEVLRSSHAKQQDLSESASPLCALSLLVPVC
jgi:cullin-associated NEDD8-dissociated protein 1